MGVDGTQAAGKGCILAKEPELVAYLGRGQEEGAREGGMVSSQGHTEPSTVGLAKFFACRPMQLQGLNQGAM